MFVADELLISKTDLDSKVGRSRLMEKLNAIKSQIQKKIKVMPINDIARRGSTFALKAW